MNANQTHHHGRHDDTTDHLGSGAYVVNEEHAPDADLVEPVAVDDSGQASPMLTTMGTASTADKCLNPWHKHDTTGTMSIGVTSLTWITAGMNRYFAGVSGSAWR